MISEPELRAMRPDSIVVNVARGGVMNEAALLRALKEKWIYAAATDVFVTEPATKEDCQLIRDCPSNLTLSPHVAWYGGTCLENLQLSIKETLESYVAGKPRTILEPHGIYGICGSMINPFAIPNYLHGKADSDLNPSSIFQLAMSQANSSFID
ncbi:hypothetical protein MKX08_010241 [Trichoderma sp. CBMAI-0020]|nr:hypothetical protein MKX08_010241 [Trichoderma sp. CBMAI-0020]